MHEKSFFYFTFNDDEEFKRTTAKDFRYPFQFFVELSDRYGFQIRNCSKQYPHPRKQSMAELRLN